MNQILITIFILNCFCIAIAQEQMNLKWGIFQIEEGTHKQLFYLGKSAEDSISDVFLTNENVEVYTNNFHLTSKFPLNKKLPVDPILTCFSKNKKTQVVYRANQSIYWRLFTPNEISFSAPHSIITTHSKKTINVKFSADSSCVLFYTIADSKNKEMELYVCSNTGNKIWNAQVLIEQAQQSINIPFLSDCNEVLYVEKLTDGIAICCAGSDFREIQRTKIDAVNPKLTGVQAINNGNGWDVLLTYNKDNTNIECLETIQFLSVSLSGTILINKKLQIHKCINASIPVELFLNNDTLLLITEKFETKRNATNNQISYGNLTVIAIDKKTESIIWQTEIFKNHYSVVASEIYATPYSQTYNELHAHKTIDYIGSLFFIYNDNCNNCKQGETLNRSHAAIDKSCVNLVRINKTTGKLTQYIYPSFSSEKYSLSIQNTCQPSRNKLLLFAKDIHYRLGTLNLPEK